MVLHGWTVICLGASIDRETNAISLLNTVERILVRKAPPEDSAVTLPVHMEVVTLWYRDPRSEPQSIESKLTLLAPDGHVLRETHYHVDLGEHELIRGRTALESIPIQGLGRYYLAVSKRVDGAAWTEVARLPLDLMLANAEDEPGAFPWI